jgi:hypothetical protein
MVDYAAMPREERLAIKNELIRNKKGNRRKEIAKKGISRIMKVKSENFPKSEMLLEKMVIEMDTPEKKKEKIDVLKKYTY